MSQATKEPEEHSNEWNRLRGIGCQYCGNEDNHDGEGCSMTPARGCSLCGTPSIAFCGDGTCGYSACPYYPKTPEAVEAMKVRAVYALDRMGGFGGILP